MIGKVVTLAATALVLGVPAAASAASVERITIDISEAGVDSFLSDECGTEVTFAVTGSVQVTLWRNSQGLIVRELDRTPRSTVTYAAAENGNAVSFPNRVVATFDYGDGARVGSEVTVMARGLFGHVTGFIPSDAGMVAFVGEVEGFDEFGIPLVDFPDPPIHDAGNRETGEDIDAAFCEALTG